MLSRAEGGREDWWPTVWKEALLGVLGVVENRIAVMVVVNLYVKLIKNGGITEKGWIL